MMALVQELMPLAVPKAQLSLGGGRCHTVSWERPVGMSTGSHSVEVTLSTGRHTAPSGARPGFDRKVNLEKLWRDFFSDPAQWWDHRLGKGNTKYPDFKHKMSEDGLWVIDKSNPPWVEAELAAMVPGRLQLHISSWNVRLHGFVRAGNYKKAMELFRQLQQEGIDPDIFTFTPILNACARIGAAEEGRRIHNQIIERGYQSNVFIANCLVDMYGKCGSLADAEKVFKNMPSRNVISWTAMILAYVKSGRGQKALELSRQMYVEGVEPDSITLVVLLNACASVSALEEGRLVHEQISRRGYKNLVQVANTLVDMYAKCGSIGDAREVFNKMPSRNVVSWNTMILGYVKCGEGLEALKLSKQMHVEGFEPDSSTFVSVLNACASIVALEEGRVAHEQISRRGYDCDVFVGNSLIDMYAKCGSIADARSVFDKMPLRDVVSWNAMILGYVKCGDGQKALELAPLLYAEDVEPDPTTFVGLLNACASIAALEEGRLVHEQISQRGYDSDVFVGNSLIDMYAKCGSIADAQRVFNEMPSRSEVSWTAMLAGYAMHGWAKDAVEHFKCMCQENIELNGVTFVCLLAACRHGGLTEEGLYYFKCMNEVYNISPTVEHYACVVDLLGRAGHLHKAEDMVRTMPCEPNATVWRCLLCACRIHGNVEIAERVAKRLLDLEPEEASTYIMLSNIYAGEGKWDRLETVHRERLEGDVK